MRHQLGTRSQRIPIDRHAARTLVFDGNTVGKAGEHRVARKDRNRIARHRIRRFVRNRAAYDVKTAFAARGKNLRDRIVIFYIS